MTDDNKDQARPKDVAVQTPDSDKSIAERALEEVNKALKTVDEAVKKATAESKSDTAQTLFGAFTITDLQADKAKDAKSGAVHDRTTEEKDKAAPQVGESKTEDLANHIQNRAQFELINSHRNIKTTVSGNSPDTFGQSEVTLKADKTAAQLAAEKLPDGDAAQRDMYAKAIVSANKLSGTGDNIPSGTKVNLPGQTDSGGISWSTGTETNTIWQDKSVIVRRNNGSGMARYDYEGKNVEVNWDKQTVNDNKWVTKTPINNPDGTVSSDETATSYDTKGRTVQKQYVDDPANPKSIVVVDKEGTRMDFAPDASGELRGTKALSGEVVDTDVRMTGDGRIYKETTDAKGNSTRKFENNSEETYDKHGSLMRTKSVDEAKNKSTEMRYQRDGSIDSLTITDTNSIIELKVNERGDMRGVKKDLEGHVIEKNMVQGADGRIYSRHWDAHDHEIRTYEDGNKGEFDRHGKLVQTTITRADGSSLELKPQTDGSFSGVKKDATGSVVDKNMRMVGIEVFSESKVGTDTVRTYENGSTKQFNDHNQLTLEQKKDVAGRELSLQYNPGEATPFKQKLAMSKDVTVEFSRTPDGRYTNEEKSSTGQLIRTTELLADGKLRYTSPVLSAETTIDKRGIISSTHELTNPYFHIKTTTETLGTEVNSKSVSVGSDGKETLLKESFNDPASGKMVEFDYDDGEKTSITIRRPEGTVSLKFVDNAWVGENRDSSGKVVEEVIFRGDQLMFKNKTDGSVRAETWGWDGKHITPQLEKMNYDVHTGTISTTGLIDMKQSYSPGRFEMGVPFGGTFGTTVKGDFSYQSSDGTAVVSHSDSTGAKLREDGKIEMWDSKNTTIDEMTARETAMSKNPDVDKRLMLEIHRKFAGDKSKIDGFYQNVEKIENAADLSVPEKRAFVNSLMQHVAYPAEIYQGSAPTCNVTTIQREMAMRDPDKYAGFVANAVIDGKFKTASGNEVQFDRDNLKAADYSARDISSRVFQTAALNVLRYPAQTYKNEGDGTGRWTVTNKTGYEWIDENFDMSGDGGAMGGLNGVEVARITTEITGEARAQIEVKSADDLIALYKQNGGPITIRVDGDSYPFSSQGPMDGQVAGHVVTVTGFDQGPPVRVHIQNQWGLGDDHSSTTTAVEAADVYNNMLRRGYGHAYAIAVSPEPDKYYELGRNPDGTLNYKVTGTPKYDDNMNFKE